MAIAQNFPALKPSLSLDFANVKALDPRITFNRASTATYYGTETAKAEENLFLYSQEFDNAAWTKVNATISATKVNDIYGQPFAQKLVEDTANAEHRLFQTHSFISGTPYTFSVFVKASERTLVHLTAGNTAAYAPRAFFDVSVGVVTSTVSGTASITDVGNGWYRCAVSGVAGQTATTALRVMMVNTGTNTTYTGDGTSGIFIFGAQLEQRDSVTAYTLTTTQPITNYIPVLESAASGVARFDHNPVTKESLGLLIEEQRTNLLLRSEEFDNAGWTKFAVSITANSNIAPDGTLTADSIIADTTNANHQVVNNFTPSVVGQAYTFSFFVKAAGITTIQALTNANWPINATFDLVAKTATLVLGTSASIVEFGNGWFRCSVTGTAAAVVNLTCFVRLTNDSFTGDGFSGIFIWGAQLEEGAFPTSYIPTVASQVTRAADAASMTGANFSSWYNQAEGTLFGDAAFLAPTNATSAGVVAVGNGTSAENIGIFKFKSLSLLAEVRAAAATQASFSQPFTATACKAAVAYQTNSFNFSVNAGIGTDDTSGITPVPNAMFIGAIYSATSFQINGHIRKISYYPVRVTNEQLQGLTS